MLSIGIDAELLSDAVKLLLGLLFGFLFLIFLLLLVVLCLRRRARRRRRLKYLGKKEDQVVAKVVD